MGTEDSFVTMRPKDSYGEDIEPIIWATLNLKDGKKWVKNFDSGIMPFYERLFDANLGG